MQCTIKSCRYLATKRSLIVQKYNMSRHNFVFLYLVLELLHGRPMQGNNHRVKDAGVELNLFPLW